MVIGGFQKNSFIDYPDKISVVVFTQGCNFHCPYCHNPKLIPHAGDPHAIDSSTIFSFLYRRRAYLDGMVITGGEPTLQSDIINFCEKIKAIGYPIKLDTNGSNPFLIKNLLSRKLIDYIAMDIKTTPERYHPAISPSHCASSIRESISLIKNSRVAHEFRTTCVKSIVSSEDIQTIVQLVAGANRYALQKPSIMNDRVLNPSYFLHHDWRYTIDEINQFALLLRPFVDEVIIR